MGLFDLFKTRRTSEVRGVSSITEHEALDALKKSYPGKPAVFYKYALETSVRAGSDDTFAKLCSGFATKLGAIEIASYTWMEVEVRTHEGLRGIIEQDSKWDETFRIIICEALAEVVLSEELEKLRSLKSSLLLDLNSTVDLIKYRNFLCEERHKEPVWTYFLKKVQELMS